MQSQMRTKKARSTAGGYFLRTFRYWFEFDTRIAHLPQHRWFRRLGLLLNLLSAVVVGVLLRSWLIGMLCLLSWLAFFLCIRLVRTNWAIMLGLLLALYWAGIGWVLGITATTYLSMNIWLAAILAAGLFLISTLLHIYYIYTRIP